METNRTGDLLKVLAGNLSPRDSRLCDVGPEVELKEGFSRRQGLLVMDPRASLGIVS